MGAAVDGGIGKQTTQATRAADERDHGIGDLAREFGVTHRAIRFYEDEGMIAPRRDGQRRLYGPRERTRLKLILRGKRLGFSLAEIREIVDLYTEPAGEARQLRLLLEKLTRRRDELLAKRADIDQSLAEFTEVAARCAARLAEIGGGSGKHSGLGATGRQASGACATADTNGTGTNPRKRGRHG